MKAKFTYFKTTGKYYTEDFGIVPDDFSIHYYSAPGLINRGENFIWLVEEDSGVPRLIIGSE